MGASHRPTRRHLPYGAPEALNSLALALLAVVVFGVGLLTALADVIPAWSIPDQWPRAGQLAQLAFVAILVAGLGLASAGVALGRERPTLGLAVAMGSYSALVLILDAPSWLSAGAYPVAVAMFLYTHRSTISQGALTLAATIAVACILHWAWAVWIHHLGASESGLFLLRVLVPFGPLVSAGALLGGLVGRQSRQAEAARAGAEAVRLEQQRSVAAAREAERAQVAQELHDVAAQHLAGLLALADAAVDLADESPTAALSLVTDLRSEGRFAAASIYGALGELRSRRQEQPKPTLDARHIKALVNRRAQRGMDLNLVVLGELEDLPAVLSVTAFRIVSECVANASKHAPGAPVSVSVLIDAGNLVVEVRNGAANKAPSSDATIGLGWGLAGLQQRAAFLGGSLTAGATSDGGWLVSALLPLEGSLADTGSQTQVFP